jgi:hypothetical protein
MMHRRKILTLGGGLGLSLVLAQQRSLRAIAAKPPQLKMLAYLPDGIPLSRKPLNQLYFLDLEGEPLPSPSRSVLEGVLVSEPPGVIPFAIALRLPAKGFGDVTLYADNNGRGFTPADFPLNLNVVFAQTRLHRVETALRQWKSQGFSFANRTELRLGRARLAVEAAISNRALAAQIKLCHESLVESLWAGEELVVSKAQQRIAKQPRSKHFVTKRTLSALFWGTHLEIPCNFGHTDINVLKRILPNQNSNVPEATFYAKSNP